MSQSMQRALHIACVTSLVLLIILCIAWELFLAPLRPGGSWLILKAVPLLIPLRGVVTRDVYTMQWASMLILLYFGEGLVRAYSDTAALSVTLAWIEIALTCVFFVCLLMYLRPIKKAAKQLARQTIDKVSK